jgi:hypothetical protein
MAHLKRKIDGKLFNIISGKILTAEEVVAKNISASFLMLESEDGEESVMAMYAPLGENAYELLPEGETVDVKLAIPEYVRQLNEEMAPLIEEAQQAAVEEQQQRLATGGDNILDITPSLIERKMETFADDVAEHQSSYGVLDDVH